MGGTKNYTHKEKRERRRDPKINAQRLKKREREEVHVYNIFFKWTKLVVFYRGKRLGGYNTP